MATVNEAVVVENVRTASMIVRKSLVEMVMYCYGGAEVLGPAISERAVGMGAEDFEGIEGTGARGTGAVVGGAGGTDAGTEGAGAGGSSVCSAIGGRSSSGISAARWSSAGPGGGRCKARGMACYRSTERVAS